MKMTNDELCACIEAAARRTPRVRHIHIDDGMTLALEDGKEVVALRLPDHGLVRLYAHCVAPIDEPSDEALGSGDEDEGETVELRSDDDGQWSIYCMEGDAAFILVLDFPEAGLDAARCEDILDRFVGELAFWADALSHRARPASHVAPYFGGIDLQIAFN